MSGVADSQDEGDCRCRPTFDAERLVLDADDCPGRGVLSAGPACLRTAIDALTAREVEGIISRYRGRERAYQPALPVAAGRFVDAVAFHDERLAERAVCDPASAAREARGRAGPVADLAVETGLVAAVEGADDRLEPTVGLAMARSRRRPRPPDGARLVDRRELSTGATVRIYDRDAPLPVYHLEPVEGEFDAAETATLATARERLAAGEVPAGRRGAPRAVRAVAEADQPVTVMTRVLRKHTRGWGVLADLFADEAVTDVFASAPVAENPLRVRVDGAAMATNVYLTETGARAFASGFRRLTGRAFSRASPTLNAAARTADRRIRATGVRAPVSEGLAFAFRAHDAAAWTLPALVANGTLGAEAAGLLSLAVERGASLLVAGARGAGKTTLLGALLWEIPPGTRTLVVEDTPELPVEGLQRRGRDVQALGVSSDDRDPGLAPAAALRTALRLGEGALVVGEVRGEEAAVLYEAMRVGGADGAVLGTIHGETAAAVRERVVTDLAVPATSFASTDAVVVLTARETDRGTERRVETVAEVVDGRDGPAFATLYAADGGADRLGRGDSRLVEALAAPGEAYADVRAALDARVEWVASVAAGPTDPATVEAARSRRC